MDEQGWDSNYTRKYSGSSQPSKPYHKEGKHSKDTSTYHGHGTKHYHDNQHAQNGSDWHNRQPKPQPNHPSTQSRGTQGPRNTQSGKWDPTKITCLKCGEKGHKADACLKINLVNIPCLFGSFSSPPITKPGMVGGRQVDLFMDSGADSSIIAKELLPSGYIQCMPVEVTGVNSRSQTKTCQTALFPAVIDGLEVMMFAAVADQKDLPHPFIVGRSIPGLDIT